MMPIDEATKIETQKEKRASFSPAEEQAEILRHRLASVIESSDDAIISKTLEGIIQTWNRGAEKIFGYTAAEVIGKSITILIPPERLNEEVEILSKLRQGQKVEHYETRRVTKDGRLLDISLTSSPVRDANGVVIGASKIARDVTSRKLAESERERLLESERAARTEAERASIMKDEFLATLSHELRTPLNAILGWSQILRRGNHSQEDLLEGLDVIERNTRVQTQLIEDLLDMSRITSGKVRLDVQQVELQDVLKAAIASIRHSAEVKDIKLRMIMDPRATSVRGDPGRLQQCFWNILSNAVKFTPKGGTIEVSLQRVNSHLEVSIVDNGAGIKPDFLPHLFERFRQADASTTRRHGGLGLGLSIVKSLVELHGGRVSANSKGEGQGSTFAIELPLMVIHAEDSSPQKIHPRSGAPESQITDHPSLDGITVLVVDDEADARNLIKRVLEECGATVFTASGSSEALELFSKERPHMIISDIGMPGEDGYDFIKKVRKLSYDKGGRTPAAALTAFARAEDRTRALRAGYQTHVAKPVEPTELTAVVASLAVRS
jgi:PAS domain S-box-containing protein